MRLFVTKGLDGEHLEEIDVSNKDISQVLSTIDAWKNENKKSKKYKIEPYNRIIFCSNHLLIDFGDWCYFFKVDDMSQEDFQDLEKLKK